MRISDVIDELFPSKEMVAYLTEPPTEQEQLFNEIKAFLNRDTKKGQEMWLWINKITADKEKQNRKSRNGVTADEIREYIKNETN